MNIQDNKWFIKINRPLNFDFTLLCFHYGGGSASVFRGWENFFPENFQLIAIQLPGRESRFSEAPISLLSEVVKQLYEEIYPYIKKEKPYGIFGHSIGALLGFELARKLSSVYLPKLLIVSAAGAPQISIKRDLITNLPDRDFLKKLKIYNGLPDTLNENEEILSTFMPMLRADLSILESYIYQPDLPLECQVLAIGGTRDPMISSKDIAAWCMQTRNLFTMRLFEGDHFFIKSHKTEVLSYLSNFIQSSY